MNNEVILTVDVGGSSCKSTLFNLNGKVVSSSAVDYPILSPSYGFAEHRIDDVWAAVIETMKTTVAKSRSSGSDIITIGFTGYAHSVVPVDRDCNPLYNSILHIDRRATKQAEVAGRMLDQNEVFRISGRRLDSNLSAFKILWLKENHPSIYDSTYKFLPIKDFVRTRFTGDFSTDVLDAGGTMLLDIGKLDWSYELMQDLGIDADKIPELRKFGDIEGSLSHDDGAKIGIENSPPIPIGCGDGVDMIGVSQIEVGQVLEHLGSTGYVAVSVDRPFTDAKSGFEVTAHILPDQWRIMGTTSAAGIALRWFRDVFMLHEVQAAKELGINPFQVLDKEASRVSPGSSGLVFLPYLIGERSPIWDAKARGAFIGIDISHEKRHFARAVLEGVGFSMMHMIDALENAGVKVGDIRATGGGAKSDLWLQIRSDIVNRPFMVPETEESSSIGLFVMLGLAAGVFKDIATTCEHVIRFRKVVRPDEKNHDVYQKLFEAYRNCYGSLKDQFDILSELRQAPHTFSSKQK